MYSNRIRNSRTRRTGKSWNAKTGPLLKVNKKDLALFLNVNGAILENYY